MALSAAREVARFVDQQIRSFPIAAAVKIWKGGLVAISAAGFAKIPAASVADVCAGVAHETADNTAGAAGAVFAKVQTLGDVVLPFAAAAQTDLGVPIYCTDDSVLTLTSTNNVYVGLIVGVTVGVDVTVRLDSFRTAP